MKPNHPPPPNWKPTYTRDQVLSVHSGLLPGRLQTKSRKLHNLRQVPNHNWAFAIEFTTHVYCNYNKYPDYFSIAFRVREVAEGPVIWGYQYYFGCPLL